MKERKMESTDSDKYLDMYMTGVIEQLKEEQKYPAVHTYNSTLNSFLTFVNSRLGTVRVDEVFCPGRLKEYENWLRDKRQVSWNTVSTYMRTLRAVYNRLLKANLLSYNATLFDNIYTKVVPCTKRSLTEGGMQKIMTIDRKALPEELRQETDYFMLMFLLRGMPFIDLCCLRRQDIQGNLLVYYRHKTKRRIAVRISPWVRNLMEECCDRTQGATYLFPMLRDAEKSGGWYPTYLKALRNFNRKLKKIAGYVEPDAKISSYTARHTWATLAFYQGTNIGIISKALGHSSIKVTENYLRPFEDEKIDDANEQLINSLMEYNVEKTKLAERKGLLLTK